MITSQNFREDIKRSTINDNKSLKRVTKTRKKAVLKRTFFVPKFQTLVSNQDISQLNFGTLADQSLFIAIPNKEPSKERSKFSCLQAQPSDKVESFEFKLNSLISLQQRQKTVFLKQRSPTNKIWEVFGDQDLTDYLSSINNMAEYKYGCQYFHVRPALIIHSFLINELKNIFIVILLQFLEDNKEYNRKIAYKTFKNKYNWVMD